MAGTLIRGDQVTLTIDADDYTMDVKSVSITSDEDSDATTFAGKGYTYKLTITVQQKTGAADTLYDVLWDNPGDTVPFVVKAAANDRAVSGTVRLPDNAPEWGGDAFAAWTHDVELEVIGRPVRAAASGS